MTLLEELKFRGFINQSTNESALGKIIKKNSKVQRVDYGPFYR